MIIPSFEEFLNTITKEEFCSWVDHVNPINMTASKNQDGKHTINANDLVSAILYLNQRILHEYHEWLCKQIKENNNN